MENYIIYPKQLKRHVIPVEKNRCFFLMPFAHEFDVVYGTIKKALNENNMICNRADEIFGSTPVLTKILTEIMKSQYIIVDLTNSNPNVYYELGIAHTLKEARNVLLIKQKDYKPPFDISHLTYIEYDKQNLLLLVSTILSFIDSGRTTNALYEALNIRGIINYIDDNDNDFVEYMQIKLADSIPDIINILLGEHRVFSKKRSSQICILLRTALRDLVNEHNDKIFSKIFDVIIEILISIPDNAACLSLVSELLGDLLCLYGMLNISINEYKTRLAIKLASNNLYMDVSLSWIINYFSRSKSTNIDLNRYTIESFLLTSQSSKVNQAIITSLCNPDCYIREHMSDIIGEKKMYEALELLFTQLPKEINYFTAQSMIEAIGKLGSPEGISIINDWVENNKNHIIKTNQLFVLKHVRIVITKLDTTEDKIHITRFNNEFGEILKDYYIV